jgi:D-alanyl-lipoteichoic acid acyltransferase DltB (MBOAT superfamily)
MFFPQLVAGPIERPKELIPQLQTIHTFNRGKVVSGLRQMLWGFFKKIVVASPMAVLVDFVYHHSATADASALLLAVVLFYFVLYADFSGYTDIALGSARMLGIELVENFDQPYFARSITEFWRRWHISLSNWFRDYLFYPLAWNFGRFGKYGLYGAIIITFTLMGVWHGAGWNFLIMGFLFGLYIVLEQATLPVRDRIWIALGLETVPGMRRGFEILATFMLTAITWIFFRVKDFGEAMHIFSGLVSGWGTHVFSYLTCSNYCAFYEIGISRKALAIALLSLGIVLLYESVASGRLRLPAWMNTRLFRWLVYYFLMLWLLVFGYFAPTSFIYFQF